MGSKRALMYGLPVTKAVLPSASWLVASAICIANLPCASAYHPDSCVPKQSDCRRDARSADGLALAAGAGSCTGDAVSTGCVGASVAAMGASWLGAAAACRQSYQVLATPSIPRNWPVASFNLPKPCRLRTTSVSVYKHLDRRSLSRGSTTVACAEAALSSAW